jgi:hypothetical protein
VAWPDSRSSRRFQAFPLVVDLVDVDSQKWGRAVAVVVLAETLDLRA